MTPPPASSGPPGSLTPRQRRECTARALQARTQIDCDGQRQELSEYVVSINMGVATAVVSRWASRALETEDLLKVAHAALTLAVRDVEPGRYDQFLSYALPVIRRALKQHLRDRGWPGPARRG